MPQNVVFSMAQTHDGYLWLGTGNGLARFDGARFKTFDEEQAQSLNDSAILRVFEDSHRNLWFATDNGGVLLVDQQGKITSLLTSDPFAGVPLSTICEDTRGDIWFTTSKGQLYHFAEGIARLVLLNCPRVMADHSGLVWISTTRRSLLGVNIAAGGSQLPVQYEVHPGSNPDYLLASKGGGYWCLADGRITKWQRDRLEKDLGKYPWSAGVPIWAACEDLEGNLIVGTWGEGVYWFDPAGKATRVQGLSHDTIWCLLVDREGILWVGSNGGGLHRVNRQKFDVLAGTRETTVQSVCPDAQGGIWIGYHGERVDHWNGTIVQQFTNILPVASAPPPGLGLYVQSVFQDSQQRVWIGGSSTMPEPQCFFRIQDGRTEPVTNPPALNRNPSAIYQDGKGLLWIGTQAGLVCSSNGAWKVYTTREGLSSDYVRAIAADHSGNLWVGTDRGGLNHLRDGQFTVFRKQPAEGLPGDDVRSLYVDREDVLWIGTSSGLARYDHGHWARFTTRDGLASNRVGYLLEDDQGYLWIGSPAGLMRVPKRSLNEFARSHTGSISCRVFGKLDGLPTGECSAGSQPGTCRTTDGTLWFPTIKGLVRVHPSQLQPNTNPPPVIIEAVRVDGRLQTPDTLRAAPPTGITIPAGKVSVEIYFAKLSLSAPESGLFKYRLEGHERDWTEAEAQRRYARYSRLPHGHYRFQVKACNEDGLWNEAPATIELTVLPSFWQTWWFVTGSTVVLLGLIVGSVSYVSTQRLQRQLALLRQQEALEKERARIARDLHDQLGANLTQVALLGELAEADSKLPKEVESHARQICQTARETTHALDEIVWTVNPSNDTLDGLINYVCKYAQDYLGVAGLKYRLDVPSELPSSSITPELRHNVFLAAKEAINNVVKHSRASSAWVRLGLEPHRFILEIEDNGRGLSGNDAKKGRNGLRNMRKRMEEVGGQFEISHRQEGGTRVKLVAPLRVSAGIDGNSPRN
jgi:ligand-binding sensor domain-containing protein/signal transduction histidine kinase